MAGVEDLARERFAGKVPDPDVSLLVAHVERQCLHQTMASITPFQHRTDPWRAPD